MIKLIKVKIYKFKSFESEQELSISDDVTALVGMNESGKTAFLQALAKSNYFEEDSDFEFNETPDYPRKQLKKMQRTKKVQVATELFYQINESIYDDFDEIVKDIKIVDNQFSIKTKYDNSKKIDLSISLSFEEFLKSKGIPDEEIKELSQIKNKEQLSSLLSEIEDPEIKARIEKISVIWENTLQWDEPHNEYIYRNILKPKLPKFIYYDEYYTLPNI